jgi:hypothetical protein
VKCDVVELLLALLKSSLLRRYVYFVPKLNYICKFTLKANGILKVKNKYTSKNVGFRAMDWQCEMCFALLQMAS